MYRKLLVVFLVVLISATAIAQAPGVKWSKYFYNSFPQEVITDARKTSDKGYVILLSDTLYRINKNNKWSKLFHGSIYVTKVDSSLNYKWSDNFTIGNATSVILTSDESVVVSGVFDNFQVLGNSLDTSIRLTKYSSTGAMLWFKQYGGTVTDYAYQVRETIDGGFIIAGFTDSDDGDVVKLHPGTEVWLLKLDSDGNKEWTKTYGGSGNDSAYAVYPVSDGGYIVCGTSTSSDGDLTGNNGLADGWVFKVDGTGNLLWQKNFGGSQRDVLNGIKKNPDESVIISGYTFSNDMDVSGNHGNADVWVIKVDGAGNLVWSKVYGGSGNDAGLGIDSNSVQGVYVTGFAGSGDGDVTGFAGNTDSWTISLDADGNLIWQKCVGTIREDFTLAVLAEPDNTLTIVGAGKDTRTFAGEVRYGGLIANLGASNTIKGILFTDSNGNGAMDSGESLYTGKATVKAEKNNYSRSAIPFEGVFSIDVDSGDYNTSVQFGSPYFSAIPAGIASSFPDYYSVDSLTFAVQFTPDKQDLTISMASLNPARPGFSLRYLISYANIGTTDIGSGTITLEKDSRLNFISAIPAPTSINGDLLTWDYANLNSLDASSILINFTCAIPPTVNNGDTLRSVAWIDPVASDETPGDDTAVLKQIVVGSYDPNDKTEANAGIITPDQVSGGDYLNYLIRFQNTGTDTAFTVIVRDILDARLDPNTLEMVTASHPYLLTIEDDDKLSWTFNGILLPDSNVNEPASHGYIAYRIKPKPTVAIGDTIHNYASIYFDFNLPVITNNALTIVLSNVALPVNLSAFQARLNGHVVDVNWKTATELNSDHFEIQRSANGVDFVTIGTVTATNLPNGSSYAFTDNSPANGYNYYRLKSVDVDNAYEYSTIVLINLNEAVSIISSIYPNPTSGSILLKLQGSIKGNVRVQVIDQLGREVAARQFGQQNTSLMQTGLELGTLKKGHYILRIYIDEKIYLHKLLVQ